MKTTIQQVKQEIAQCISKVTTQMLACSPTDDLYTELLDTQTQLIKNLTQFSLWVNEEDACLPQVMMDEIKEEFAK